MNVVNLYLQYFQLLIYLLSGDSNVQHRCNVDELSNQDNCFLE